MNSVVLNVFNILYIFIYLTNITKIFWHHSKVWRCCWRLSVSQY